MWEGSAECLRDFRQICTSLNLDKSTTDDAWKNYSTIQKNLTLDGDQKPWLGCAIYLACRSARVNTVGKPSATIEGNLISLTSLLNDCDMTVLDFFKKCKKWMEWSESPNKVKARLEHLERKFTVCMVVFLKYKVIFVDMFKEPVSNTPPPKSKKFRKEQFPANKLFEFCWTLFLNLKARVSIVAEDLVNSFHLLLATCDLIYANVLLADRRDLLNPKFPGLPENFLGENQPAIEKAPCIVDILCQRHTGLSLEAQFAKTYCLRPQIATLLRSGVLQGTKQSPESLLNVQHFEANMKSLDYAYSEYVVSVGDIDERIFLNEDSAADIGSRPKQDGSQEETTFRRDPSTHNVMITPLSGRELLKDKDATSKSQAPLSSVTNAISSLMQLIKGRSVGKPSEALLEKFRNCSFKLEKLISDRLVQMGDNFIQASLVGQVPGHDTQAFFKRRLEFATTLYYRVLEKIISKEQAPDLSELLNNDLIHRSVFACCLEIVMFSYNAQRPFPWVEDTLGIDPLHFYRIIEIILRADDGISSNVIKYLQTIEERVLESYAWRTNSPLWDQIRLSDWPVPKCDEVSFSNQLLQEDEMKSDSAKSSRPQLADRFGSPVKNVRPGQSVLNSSYKAQNHQSTINAHVQRPTRTGSLALFFRKFYFLANLRMQDLCTRLDICDINLRRKIWTCFEYSMVNNTDLMRDRHLDQILMCAVYVMCRVLHTPEQPTQTQFTDILKVYRNQPQATSAVYRNVLLVRGNCVKPSQDGENFDTRCVAEERGNLIQFYNNVYMHEIEAHAREYGVDSRNNSGRGLPLSPLPRMRPPASPAKGKLTPHARIFMAPMENQPNFDDIVANTYVIHSSPAKDLDRINESTKSLVRSRLPKRLLQDDNGPPTKKSPAVYMKLTHMMKDRSKP